MRNKQNDSIRILGDESGFTLLELVLVSVALLIIIGISASFSNQVDSNTDLIVSQQAVTTIQGSTKGSFKTRGNYLGLENSIAKDLDIFPRDMVDETGSLVIRNRYDGTVTLRVNASNSLQQQQIWTGLPMAACMKMALYSPETWVFVDINGTSIDPTADSAMADANGACNDTGNTITWTSN